MEATIKSESSDKVELQLKNRVVSIPRSKLKFEFEVGDTIIVRKVGEEFVFIKKIFDVPESKNKTRKPKKKTFKHKSLIIAFLCVASVITGICLIPSATIDNEPNIVNDKPTDEDLRGKLDNCLEKTSEEEYEAKIKCYRKYDVEESANKIAELEAIIGKNEQYNDGYSQTDVSLPEWNSTIPLPNYEDSVQSNGNSSNPSPQVNIPQDNSYYTPPKNVATPEATTKNCDDYHSQYYAEYITKKNETISYYNSAISSARNSCSSFGGCPAASNLERQRDVELARIKSNYNSNMQSVGCEPR
jgi:hypothetical protein